MGCCPKLEATWRRLKRWGKGATIVAFLAFYGFLIFNIGAASYSNYPKKQQQYQANAGAECCASQKPPFGSWWEWTTHDPVAFYTSLLAGFTLLLAVSTVGLWIATWLAARRAETSLHFVEGAWLFAGPRLKTIGDGDGMQMQIVNYGKTPALVIEYHMEFSNSAPVGDTAIYAGVAQKPNFPMGVRDIFYPTHRFIRRGEKFAFG